jgi:chemotaxis protein CheD
MISPLNPLDIFLRPGDCYFGGQNTSIRTVLGSCVSMTFWHPQLRVGGMCHYMLPKRNRTYSDLLPIANYKPLNRSLE